MTTDPFYDWSSIRPMPSRRGNIQIRAAASSPGAPSRRGSADSPSPLESAESLSLHTALAPLTRDRVNLAAGRFVHRTDDELTGGFFIPDGGTVI